MGHSRTFILVGPATIALPSKRLLPMQTVRRLVRVALITGAVPMLVTTVLPQGAAQEPQPMINQSSDGLLKPFRFRSIGPASMGGRIDDIAVSDSDPSIIYLGY